MTESELNKIEIQEQRELFIEVSNKLIYFEKYQIILCIFFSLATYSSVLMSTIYPSQKNLPEYICLTTSQNEKILNDLGYNTVIDFDNSPKDSIIKIYSHYSSLFRNIIKNTDNLKIVRDETCIIKYCSNSNEISIKLKNNIVNEENSLNIEKLINEKNNSTNLKNHISFEMILLNYDNLRNFITEYDAFCDSDIFWENSQRLINFGKMCGNIFFGFISDKYGRLKAYNLLLYSFLISYSLIFIFRFRIFFYIFTLVTSSCYYIYMLSIIMASELMTPEYNGLLNTSLSFIFSISGILCISFMYIFNDFYYIFLLQTIVIYGLFYFSKFYILETFSFYIKKNLFFKALKNINYLDKLFDLKMRENEIYKRKIEKMEAFVKKNFSTKEENIENLKNNSNKDYTESNLKNKIDLIKKDCFLKSDHKHKINSNNQELLIKNYKSEISPSQEDYSLKKFYYLNMILGPYYDIFSSTRQIKIFFKFLPIFLCVYFIYFGQLFNIDNLDDDVYLASLVMFFSEILGEIISLVYITKFERKTLLYGTTLLTGCFYLLGFFFQNYKLIRLFSISGGTTLVSVAFIVLYLFLGENTDVEIKSSMISILNILCMILLFFVPDIIYWFKNLYALFAISCFSSIFLSNLMK